MISCKYENIMLKNKIVNELIQAYWADIENIINYIAHSVNLDGVRAEAIRKSLAVDIGEELIHTQGLAKRIKELGEERLVDLILRSLKNRYNPRKIQRMLLQLSVVLLKSSRKRLNNIIRLLSFAMGKIM